MLSKLGNTARNKLLLHAILVAGAAVMVIPFLWMILTSLKTMAEATVIPPRIFPNSPRWDNYVQAFTLVPFLKFYQNTILMTIGRTAGQLVFCTMAAYAFARIRFPGRTFLFMLFLSVLMVPAQIFLIPQYLIMIDLGWTNSLKALIIPGMFSGFGTFLMRQFFMTLPIELEEAARIDGCNQMSIFLRIMLPLTTSGLVSLAILTMIWSWNDFLWPIIVNNSTNKLPLSAGLATFQGQYFTDYPTLMAGALMAIWPMVLVYAVMQKQFIQGIALSGTKA